ncbi:MAG: hypothetical protein M3Z17_03260 [Gemmatimonadota bacterium]|nr:hypothetical protein [Gemmatimonadota bacterium]
MRHSAVVLPVLLILAAAAGCQKDSPPEADAGFLQGASGEAKEALASPVSFQLNEESFAKWEVAERNLDRIPASEFTAPQPSGGTVVDRAVARLQSSSRAKRAIEAAGLSLHDFVLETIALAQAVQASQTGRSAVASGVAAENFAFVERYRERIRQSGLEGGLARQGGDSEITDPRTAAELAAARVERTADSISNAADSLGESLNNRSNPRRSRDSLRDTLNDSLSALLFR